MRSFGLRQTAAICSTSQSSAEGGRSIRTIELWGAVYPILLDGLLDAGWEFTSVEQVHEFFKKLMAHEQVVNFDTGEIVEIPKSTATMDTQQFATYIEKLREYAQEFLNVTIPEPDKNWKLNKTGKHEKYP